MKDKIYWLILGTIVMVTIVAVVWMGKLSKEIVPAEMKKIFFVHSYDSADICGKPQDDGAVAGLEKFGYKDGENIKIYRFYMDTKTTYTKPEEMKMRGEMAIEEIKKEDPDVILVIDDNAFRYVAMPLAKSKYPIVFTGMNDIIEDYDQETDVMENREYPGYNITGVLETLHFGDSFRLLQKIVPGAKKVFLTGDDTSTCKGFMKVLKMEMEREGAKFPVEVEIKTPKDFEEYKQLIAEANQREDIDLIFPFSLVLKGSDGKMMGPAPIITWTLHNSKKPEVGASFFMVEFGYLAGAAVDFPALGEQAVAKAVEILEGKNPGEIPIEEAATVSVCVNLARAEQLGIKVPLEVITKADKTYKSMKLYSEYQMKGEE